MVSDIQIKFFDMPGHKEMELLGKKKLVYWKRHRNDKDDSISLGSKTVFTNIFKDLKGTINIKKKVTLYKKKE